MATPPKNPTDGTAKPPVPRKPATPRKTMTRKAAASTPRKTAASAAPSADTISAASAAAASSSSDAKPSAPKPAAPRKRATSARKPAAAKAASTSSTVKKPRTAKPTGTGTGRRWGIAAAVTAAGAAVTAGLLALRSSTPANDDVAAPNESRKAHQADGTDSSASFEAGIADEGTVPE